MIYAKNLKMTMILRKDGQQILNVAPRLPGGNGA